VPRCIFCLSDTAAFTKRHSAVDAQNNDRGECPTSEDHTMRRGKKTPENGTKILFWSYSTSSLVVKDRKNIAINLDEIIYW
jgi:hypothetical protein